MMNQLKVLLCALAMYAPQALYGFGNQAPPPIKRTGAAVDGGLSCTACHRTFEANSDSRGSVRLQVSGYRPNTTQRLRVTVSHPEAMRWGFQITARLANDLTKPAGNFVPNDEVAVRCDDGTPRGSPPPCGPGQTQFASHTNTSTSPGQRDSRSWEFEWQAPTNDVGDIVFFLAGNAANNNNANSGDRIYTTEVRIENEGSCALTRRPTISAVLDAFSDRPAFAPNSLIQIKGLDFALEGATREIGVGDLRNGKFPTQISCVAVEIAALRAPILYVSRGQINTQIPTLEQRGPVPVRVILNPDRPNQVISDTATIIIQDTAPALVQRPNGVLQARFPNGTLLTDPAQVPGAHPAKAGDIIVLYATGLGQTDPPYQAGDIVPTAARLRDPVEVTVGGVTLPAGDVSYAGSAPTTISGLYQINVTLPTTLSPGNVPISIRVRGNSSQSGTTIPIAP